MHHQAFHDGLTGVANRVLLTDRISHAVTRSKRSSTPISLLFCDLDEFKMVNDTLGHTRGDELLALVTRRLVATVRSGDTVARLGGDEFAVLLDDADPAMAFDIATRLIEAVGAEASIGGHTLFPSMSVGVATTNPGVSANDLLRNADVAMYAAKRSGKGQAEVFETRMHETASGLLELQADLKSAIGSDQLHVQYQATVDLGTGEVEAVEALLRWQHPTLGYVSPGRFIRVAEATGMINAIGGSSSVRPVVTRCGCSTGGHDRC